ncbi:uncharacterized protein LOC144179462 isoform X6 [Haemaphysalis longicornis]
MFPRARVRPRAEETPEDEEASLLQQRDLTLRSALDQIQQRRRHPRHSPPPPPRPLATKEEEGERRAAVPTPAPHPQGAAVRPLGLCVARGRRSTGRRRRCPAQSRTRPPCWHGRSSSAAWTTSAAFLNALVQPRRGGRAGVRGRGPLGRPGAGPPPAPPRGLAARGPPAGRGGGQHRRPAGGGGRQLWPVAVPVQPLHAPAGPGPAGAAAHGPAAASAPRALPATGLAAPAPPAAGGPRPDRRADRQRPAGQPLWAAAAAATAGGRQRGWRGPPGTGGLQGAGPLLPPAPEARQPGEAFAARQQQEEEEGAGSQVLAAVAGRPRCLRWPVWAANRTWHSCSLLWGLELSALSTSPSVPHSCLGSLFWCTMPACPACIKKSLSLMTSKSTTSRSTAAVAWRLPACVQD